MVYLYNQDAWPKFAWSRERLSDQLARVRHRQGRLIGHMQGLGLSFRNEAALQNLTDDVVKSSEIEGEKLDKEQVRSSIARRLGLDIGTLTPADRHVDGVVEMMLDATQHYARPLTEDRLFAWHAALFPAGWSGMSKIVAGYWRDGPVQVVSGPIGRRTVHYEAPAAKRVPKEMRAFLKWLNGDSDIDPVIKAALAHLWFVTIHPFEDGNGRIARAIADMALARSEDSAQRFYSMSAQIRRERNAYYDILEKTQKAGLDVTPWLEWFLSCLDRAMDRTGDVLAIVERSRRFWEAHANESFNERQRAILSRLLDGGFEGKLTSSKWAKLAKCSPDTALRDIDDLLRRDILVRGPSGGRSTNYMLAEPEMP